VSATKVVIILLVIVAVVFAVVVLRGPRDSSPETPEAFISEKHNTLDSMNNLLARFAPKVAAKSLDPSTQVFNLALSPKYPVTVLADPSQKFRQLAFTAIPSKLCATVTYSPSDKSGLNRDQDSEHSGSKDHLDRFAFVLLSGGGQLEVRRATEQTSGTCIITLQVAK